MATNAVRIRQRSDEVIIIIRPVCDLLVLQGKQSHSRTSGVCVCVCAVLMTVLPFSK